MIAAAGLIGVFVLIASYVANVSKQVGPKVQLVKLNTSVSPYQPITPSMLGYVSVPAKWAPANALRSPDAAIGLVSDVSLPAGTELEQGMLTTPPTLRSGQQEIAIMVDTETGVAGQVTPGSEVSILATYAGNNQGTKNSARVVVPRARVLGVGSPTAAGGSATGSAQPSGQDEVVPVTFALSPHDALAVSYAESFAQKVRLSLIAPGTGSTATTSPYSPGF